MKKFFCDRCEEEIFNLTEGLCVELKSDYLLQHSGSLTQTRYFCSECHKIIIDFLYTKKD